MPDTNPTERDLMQGYWESYSKWQLDARGTKEKDLSRAKANMAVQGIGPDSPMYQQTMSRLTQEFESNVASLEAGQTKENLSQYFDQSKLAYSDYLNRKGPYAQQLMSGRSETPVYRQGLDYAGATQEEKDLVFALDKGKPQGPIGQDPRDTRTSPEYEAANTKYQGLIQKRDSLLAASQESTMEDYYTAQFGLGNQDEAPQVSPGQPVNKRQQRAAGQNQASPWW